MTYELLSKSWPGNRGEYPDLVNSSPKLVASTTLSEPDLTGSRQTGSGIAMLSYSRRAGG